MHQRCLISVVILGISVVGSASYAEETTPADPVASLAAIGGRQQTLRLPVRVVNEAGNPVVGAKVYPWALRCSQGHGLWRDDANDRTDLAPPEVVTDSDGMAIVLYPRLRDIAEGIQTIGVSLKVDHPDYAYADALHIDVPLEEEGPYEIKLATGAPVVIRPHLEGSSDPASDVAALWSDGRSWRPGAAAEVLKDGSLKIPALPLGKNSVLLVKLDGDRATLFSKIVDFELDAKKTKPLDVTLRPALRVQGKLSDNVPRPVKQGRVKVETLPPSAEDFNRVMWFTWAAVEPDGTFVIESWPADEPMQLIALCDGYIATSGKAPSVVANPRDRANDPFDRPQVFDHLEEPIEVAMTPLQTCVARAVDGDDAPVAGVEVISCPNVGWWNHGSQIYGDPLVRSERLLRVRDYHAAEEKPFPPPFRAMTNAEGEATLQLPVGQEDLYVKSEVYELPAFLGRRSINVKITADDPLQVTLRLQPRGTDKLGEWDKLAGVVFGCSTREGRRICALPGVQKKMAEFAGRFREAKDQRDPQLLAEAYAEVANAFNDIGDLEQGALWKKKAAEQSELVASNKQKAEPAKEQ